MTRSQVYTQILISLGLTLIIPLASTACPWIEDPVRHTWDLDPRGMVQIEHRLPSAPLNTHTTWHVVLASGPEPTTLDELRASFGPTVTIFFIESLDPTIPYWYIISRTPVLTTEPPTPDRPLP